MAKQELKQVSPEAAKIICNLISCKPEEIKDWEAMKVGATNSSYKFTVNGKEYFYRDPGEKTEIYLNRAAEYFAQKVAKEIGLDETFIDMDPETGWKLSYFIEDCEYLDPYKPEDQKIMMDMMRKLHDKAVVSDFEFNFVKQIDTYFGFMDELGMKPEKYAEILEKRGIHGVSYDDLIKIVNELKELEKKVDAEGYKKVLCHNDTWIWNFLRAPDGKVTLIDWEYCGNNYPAADVADFCLTLEFTLDGYIELSELYEGHPLNDKEYRFYMANMALCGWHWVIWGIWKEATGWEMGEDLKKWYDKAMQSLEICRDKYK